jgi:YaiO family outer membrane protein
MKTLLHKVCSGAGLVLGLLSVLPPGAVAQSDAEPAPVASAWDHAIEAGIGFATYSEDLGNADSQFARYLLSRTSVWSLRLDAGRSYRFGIEGTGYGATFTRFFRSGLDVAFGLSGGTGDISPRYRVDLSVGKAVLPRKNLRLILGYTYEQSRFAAHYDRVSLAGIYYLDEHWLLSGSTRLEFGHPGGTTSSGIAGGIGYGTYRKYHIGAGFDIGKVSYQILGTDDAIVDYYSFGIMLGLSYYFQPNWGATVRFDFGDTEFYNTGGVILSVFMDW